jgi:hypothetical protein
MIITSLLQLPHEHTPRNGAIFPAQKLIDLIAMLLQQAARDVRGDVDGFWGKMGEIFFDFFFRFFLSSKIDI